jgi:CRISPR-associated protein Csb2
MPTLFLRFRARRYHATPWGHHVNEGLIEWPPSPWRLLRALLSVGYTSGLWNGSGPAAVARSLIEKLAGVLPTYSLPPACGAHTRHYMPLATLKAPGAGTDKSYVLAHQITGGPIVHGYKEDTTLVFDTWAQVDDGELAVTWDVNLSNEEIELLARLAERLGYLGRAESWVVARLAKADEPVPAANCFHERIQTNPGPGWEQVPLMAPESQADFAHWRAQSVARALAEYPLPESKKTSKKLLDNRAKAEEPYPIDLIDCLQKSSKRLRDYGWSQPPGSRRVFYWRKTDALEAGAPKVTPRVVTAPPVEAMLLSMATASGNNHALPSVTRTLPQAELLHRALVSLSEKHGVHSRALTGCDEKGRPLRGPHDHAHILPLDLDGDGHLEHILLWAPMGLNDRDQAAVRAVRQTFTKGGIGPLRLALAGSGHLSDLTGLPGGFGDGLRAILGLHVGAVAWRSLTPFVPPRYIKKRGRNTIEGQIAAELAARNFPPPAEVRVINPHEDEHARRHRHFVRSRRHGPAAPVDRGFSLELRFSYPVRGPICLGYGSHFGLGLFVSGSDG